MMHRMRKDLNPDIWRLQSRHRFCKGGWPKINNDTTFVPSYNRVAVGREEIMIQV